MEPERDRDVSPPERSGAPAAPVALPGTVIAGPRWYRRRIRRLGPFVGLVPPAVLGAMVWWMLRSTEGRTSGLLGLAAGAVAAPGLLVVGAPFGDESSYRLAVVASATLWLLIGTVASRRATRRSLATWKDYWREYTWMGAGVAVGVVGALAVAAQLLGEIVW